VGGAEDHKTGRHHLVLEDGEWIELGKSAGSPVNDQAAKPNSEDEDADDDSGKVDISKLALPYVPHLVNPEYLQETGNAVYTVFPDRDRFHGNKPNHHRILLVLSRPANAQQGAR
jgi:hypothetical protein